jgi:hypothetical protein
MKQIQSAAFDMPEYEVRSEGAYRPRISAAHLRHLWLLKSRTGKPMTRLVSEALDYYFESRERR